MSPDNTESRCNRPPMGWECTRTAGHEGPCAAISWLSEVTAEMPVEARELWREHLTTRNGWQGVGLDGVELADIAMWLAAHLVKCPNPVITIAQSCASGIGTNTVIKCQHCNEGLDATDYDSW